MKTFPIRNFGHLDVLKLEFMPDIEIKVSKRPTSLSTVVSPQYYFFVFPRPQKNGVKRINEFDVKQKLLFDTAFNIFKY